MYEKLRGDRCEEGSTTVEFVMWVPIFTLMMITILDASVLMMTQSRLYDVARQEMRLYTLGAKSLRDAEMDAISQFRSDETDGASAEITEHQVDPDDENSARYATMEISIPTREVVIFTGRFFANANLSAEYSMVLETASPAPGS
ncbi:TadE family protein [Algicella marina]|uniref:TadE-like domain-containing protein n=1 Tax=Algicella marina TaxID=2683284 RepID=A0A6P1T3I7_9RHOB|nr:TadE family protein [Algicella marina]QHQ36280.1 hypothetical protein GO499_14410 [Algicella marina]